MTINFNAPTIGIVVDTNDPTQMGRVRALCTAWGDSPKSNVHEIVWAQYVTPFGGTVSSMTRGAGIQQSTGGLTYGMWGIPKVGAQVVVMCVNGDPSQRYYVGCVYDANSTNSLPHGRYMYDDHPALESVGAAAKPAGPYTNSEGFVEPLNSNQKAAFQNYGATNYEWQTRAADYTASAIDIENVNDSFSKVSDDKDVEYEGRLYTQGYQSSRIDPNSEASQSHANHDSQVYCIVSPGFHAISMDDRQENCRMRLRTVGGHQIIMDDTNERIYIATARGQNWIELDQAGNIDIFSNSKVNVRSTQDINLTSDKSIKMTAGENIHLRAGKQIRMLAKEDIHIKTPKNMFLKCNIANLDILQDLNVHVGSNFKLTAKEDIHITSKNTYHTYEEVMNVGCGTYKLNTTLDCNMTMGSMYVKTSSGTIDLESATTLQLKSNVSTMLSSLSMQISGDVVTTITGGGATMRLMGVLTYPATPAAISATPLAPVEADPAIPAPQETTLTAFLTNRVPDHEPWGRVMTKETVDEETQEIGDFSHEPELSYTDPQVGKFERGLSIIRSMFWRR